MVLREDEDTLVTALSRIAEAIEDNSDILKGIKAHYDGVVPIMTRNAKRAEDIHKEAENSFSNQVKSIFAS